MLLYINMNNIKIYDINLSLGDFVDISFTTTNTNYTVGFYEKDPSNNSKYVFKEYDKISTIKDPEDYSELQKQVRYTVRKLKSKYIFLFLLTFIIIGNSSIYYYFEQVNYDDFGIFNVVIKCLYHVLGCIFLIKMIQYVYFTCAETDLYRSKYNTSSYILDPLNSTNIIPVAYDKIESLQTALLTKIGDVSIQEYLTYEQMNKNKYLTSSSKPSPTIGWVSLVFSIIAIYILSFKLTLDGVPIYGVLYYYNPLAFLNITGFYNLLNPIWRLDNEECDELKEMEKSSETGQKKENANKKSTYGNILNKTAQYTHSLFATYVGTREHLVFDAYKLRSMKVHKNAFAFNTLAQIMYIYNSAIYFLNPGTLLILLLGLGYVPATPVHFIDGSSTVEAMRKKIVMPFFKKWLFYFAQGRCYRSNLIYGVIRRLCTLGMDTWTADAIFNNDNMKLVCDSTSYFGYIFIVSSIIFFLNTNSSLADFTSINSKVFNWISFGLSVVIILYCVFSNKGSKSYNVYDALDYTKENDIKKNDEKISKSKLVESYNSSPPYRGFAIENITESIKSISELKSSNIYEFIFLVGTLSIIIIIFNTTMSSAEKWIIAVLLVLFVGLNVGLNKRVINYTNLVNKLTQKVKELKNIKSKPNPTNIQDSLQSENINKTKETNDLHNTLNTLIDNLKSKSESKSDNSYNLQENLNDLIISLKKSKDSSQSKDSSTRQLHDELTDLIIKLKENEHSLSSVFLPTKKLGKKYKDIEKHNDDITRGIYDINFPINYKTNLFMTLLLNKVRLWNYSKKSWWKHIIPIIPFKKKSAQIAPIPQSQPVSSKTQPQTQTQETEQTGGSPDSSDKFIKFSEPTGNYINDSRSQKDLNNELSSKIKEYGKSTIEQEYPKIITSEVTRLYGQKYSDWTQFFTGGSNYEDKSLFLTQFKCNNLKHIKNTNKASVTQQEVCTKLSNKKDEDVTVGVISILQDDIDTLIKGEETTLTDKELCNKLYRNKPRCLTVTKLYRNVESNFNSQMILELEVTNECTGDKTQGVDIDGSVYRYKDIQDINSEIGLQRLTDITKTHLERYNHHQAIDERLGQLETKQEKSKLNEIETKELKKLKNERNRPVANALRKGFEKMNKHEIAKGQEKLLKSIEDIEHRLEEVGKDSPHINRLKKQINKYNDLDKQTNLNLELSEIQTLLKHNNTTIFGKNPEITNKHDAAVTKIQKLSEIRPENLGNSSYMTGGGSKRKESNNAFNYRQDLRNSGQEYFVPIEYLDYTKNLKYKINDIQVDPVNSKIKIFGLDKRFEYTPEKIQEVVGTYLNEQRVEEIVDRKLEQDKDMEEQMTYKEYMKYKETNHLNSELADETAKRYMATGGGSTDFKKRFREKFKETVQGQSIIEKLLHENKNKVEINKYDNIMKMGGQKVIIKTGAKERYITSSGELLPVKEKDTSKDYVDVVTLNDEPMKINVKGKECYMTHDGGLINVRQNKNIYKRRKRFKKKIR